MPRRQVLVHPEAAVEVGPLGLDLEEGHVLALRVLDARRVLAEAVEAEGLDVLWIGLGLRRWTFPWTYLMIWTMGLDYCAIRRGLDLGVGQQHDHVGRSVPCAARGQHVGLQPWMELLVSSEPSGLSQVETPEKAM